jgi:hypothetical protein
MTPSEAKLRILAGWRTWVGHQQSAVSRTTAEALAFLKEIEQNKPELLSFDSADKWEFVKSWLLKAALTPNKASRNDSSLGLLVSSQFARSPAVGDVLP